MLYAMKFYDNPSCKGTVEFMDDLKRFRYLKRLFKKYQPGRQHHERLIINHIIVINNLFGNEAATNMLFFKIDKKYWSQLKTFLSFLSYLPIGYIVNTQGEFIPSYELPLDEHTVKSLEKI